MLSYELIQNDEFSRMGEDSKSWVSLPQETSQVKIPLLSYSRRYLLREVDWSDFSWELFVKFIKNKFEVSKYMTQLNVWKNCIY